MIANRVSVLALVAVMGATAVAHAQTPPPPREPGAEGYPTWAPGSQLRQGEHQGERQAARLEALHNALNIRPDQEQAFQGFAAGMKPTGEGRNPEERGRTRQEMAAMTTPDRLDAIGRMMDERMQRMRERFQRRAAAVKALYAALSPDQRHTLDALPGLMGPGMGMGGDRGRGPRGIDKPGTDVGPPHRSE